MASFNFSRYSITACISGLGVVLKKKPPSDTLFNLTTSSPTSPRRAVKLLTWLLIFPFPIILKKSTFSFAVLSLSNVASYEDVSTPKLCNCVITFSRSSSILPKFKFDDFLAD